MATFVLVHGAWHGGWCYGRVAERLQARGHAVYRPTLTGLGERAHLLSGTVNLSTHITDVASVLRWDGLSDVVLCGHSYGGMVITGVADALPDRIGALVYLDAMLPEDGQSALELMSEGVRQHVVESAGQLGGYAVPPVPAAAFKVNEADQAWVDAQCTPMPLAALQEAVALSGAHRQVQRRHYVYAMGRHPSAFTALWERLKTDPAWTVTDLPCGHDMMVDMPDELADLLEQAADGA